MEAAFAAGYTVAIATQPVFPLVAIQQRLEWAGVADFPYALITSYEIMHTTKPHPAFYRDVCAMIGHRPEDCLMVGNDPDSDIRPAAAAGLHTFWLADEGQPPIADLPAEHSGALRDVHRLILSWRT
jgi:FMN phosphatase YigB (HAD superfamily)